VAERGKEQGRDETGEEGKAREGKKGSGRKVLLRHHFNPTQSDRWTQYFVNLSKQ